MGDRMNDEMSDRISENDLSKLPRKFFCGDQTLGSPVRNALTGTYYNDILFGSKREHLLWSVKMPDSTDKYFFDSPEQYETGTFLVRNRYVTVDQELKNKWRINRSKYL